MQTNFNQRVIGVTFNYANECRNMQGKFNYNYVGSASLVVIAQWIRALVAKASGAMIHSDCQSLF